MAVAYDNSITKDDFGVTGLTTAGFTISGSNRAACLGLTTLANTSAHTGSCSGVSANVIASTNLLATGIEVVLLSVIAPVAGAGKTATVGWTTAASASVGVITFTGVDQTTPANNGVTKSAAFASSISQAITSTSGDMTTSMYAGGGSDGAATSNQTKRTSDFGCLDTGGGAGTTTHTWSHAAEDMVFSGANFVQVAAGGGTWGPLLGGQNNRLVQA